jgi:hypothetical protein
METISNLNVTDRNTDIPFFPSLTWNLTNSDFGDKTLLTFNYIQAFFDPTLTLTPYLCVYSGNNDDSGNPILSQIRFAYSGEKVQIKAKGIFSTGTNIRGQTVTSLAIGATPTTQFSEVVAYGGMR